MSNFQKIALAVLAVLALAMTGYFAYKCGDRRGYKRGYEALHPTDTVWRTDTHYVDVPVEVIKWKDKEKPVYIAVHDTTMINDTAYVVMPREFKVYQDSTYMAQVSGVDPSMDWIQVYQKTAYVTNYVEVDKTPRAVLSAYATAGFPLRATAGMMWEERIAGPLYWNLRTGYEWNGVGWYAAAGVRVVLRTEW